jgi:hypothetical protein
MKQTHHRDRFVTRPNRREHAAITRQIQIVCLWSEQTPRDGTLALSEQHARHGRRSTSLTQQPPEISSSSKQSDGSRRKNETQDSAPQLASSQSGSAAAQPQLSTRHEIRAPMSDRLPCQTRGAASSTVTKQQGNCID